MRVAKKKIEEIKEGDLTPMIDMTFQLIAFFMVLINFSEVERTEAINLPASQLAKPPEETPDFRILLNIQPAKVKKKQVSFAGHDKTIKELGNSLRVEVENAKRRDVEPEAIVVIIRADKDTPMVEVLELIAKCQDAKMETFSFRVKEQIVR